MGQPWPLSLQFNFHYSSQNNDKLQDQLNYKNSMDRVLGIRTQGRKMESADESTEL